MNPAKTLSFLCALCVEAATSATPAQNALTTRFQLVMDTQDACPPTPAQAFLANLRQLAESGRFVYSWTNPWRPADPAFRVQEEGGWTSEGKECFKRFLQRPEVIILRGGNPSAVREMQ
ncbi:MAG: hypothetical protein ILM98_15030 [Kiritimatiellae bacterium]|nr:hypothetical protein [Kiritimatiellia bacterium]